MRKNIKSVVKGNKGAELARTMGCSQPWISQVVNQYPDAWVYFDDDGVPSRIEYQKTIVLNRKS